MQIWWEPFYLKFITLYEIMYLHTYFIAHLWLFQKFKTNLSLPISIGAYFSCALSLYKNIIHIHCILIHWNTNKIFMRIYWYPQNYMDIFNYINCHSLIHGSNIQMGLKNWKVTANRDLGYMYVLQPFNLNSILNYVNFRVAKKLLLTIHTCGSMQLITVWF